MFFLVDVVDVSFKSKQINRCFINNFMSTFVKSDNKKFGNKSVEMNK